MVTKEVYKCIKFEVLFLSADSPEQNLPVVQGRFRFQQRRGKDVYKASFIMGIRVNISTFISIWRQGRRVKESTARVIYNFVLSAFAFQFYLLKLRREEKETLIGARPT